MQKLQGRNVMVFADELAIACCRSCEITIDTDLIETSSPMSGRFKTYIPGRVGWQITTGQLIPVYGFEDYMLQSGQELNITIGEVTVDRHVGPQVLEGVAIVKSTKATLTLASLAQGGMTLVGNGPLKPTKGEVVSVKGIVSYDAGTMPVLREEGIHIGREWTTGVMDKLYRTILDTGTLKPTFITTEIVPDYAAIYQLDSERYAWVEGTHFSLIK